jgi:hypothetical protein
MDLQGCPPRFRLPGPQPLGPPAPISDARMQPSRLPVPIAAAKVQLLGLRVSVPKARTYPPRPSFPVLDVKAQAQEMLVPVSAATILGTIGPSLQDGIVQPTYERRQTLLAVAWYCCFGCSFTAQHAECELTHYFLAQESLQRRVFVGHPQGAPSLSFIPGSRLKQCTFRFQTLV